MINTPDAMLRRAVFARLGADPLISTRCLDLTVDRGVVALSGYVTSNAQRDAACATAMRVHGVSRVINDVQVAIPGTLVDESSRRRTRLTLPKLAADEGRTLPS